MNKNIIWESQTVSTRSDIFAKRANTGKAEFHSSDVESVYIGWMCNSQFSIFEVHYTEEEDRTEDYVSIMDLLFWPSNFFEIMFNYPIYNWEQYEWARINIPFHKCSNECYGDKWHIVKRQWINLSDYHKSQCAILDDKLKYLLESLPSD